MASNNFFYFILTFLLLLLEDHHLAWSSDPATQKLIDKICRQIEQYGFCSQTFEENLKSPNSDMVGLTQITVEQALNNATLTYNFILYELYPNGTHEEIKDMLEDCIDGYRVVMEAFQSAAIAFFSKDYERMLNEERVAPKAQAGCTVTFPTPPFPFDQLVIRNAEMRMLISMALICAKEINGYAST